jgi:hypothetical protein
MKYKIWLLFSGACLISTHLQADDSDYASRQFNINPGNVMDGMFNPMRNFFGGSNRYADDYYNYRSAPPLPYHPGYGYPGAGYGYPPAIPGYRPLPQGGIYPSYSPNPQPPAPMISEESPQTPSAAAYDTSVPAEPTQYEKFRFRPLDNKGMSADMTPRNASESNVDQGVLTPQQGYESTLTMPQGAEVDQLKFRPLDQPGYTN